MEKSLPRTNKEWKSEISNADIEVSKIQDLELSSASKIKFIQYLLLRVLWRTYPNRYYFDPKCFGLSDYLERAREILSDSGPWKDYVESVTTPETEAIPDLGSFSLPRYYQLLVKRTKENKDENNANNVIFSPIRTRSQTNQIRNISAGETAAKMQALYLETPTKKGRPSESSAYYETNDDLFGQEPSPSSPWSVVFSPISKEAEAILYPPTRDEQTVNMALILLLDALTIHSNWYNDWIPDRRMFTVNFRNSLFRARVDGCLEDKTGDRVRALVEVKPHIRENSVRMQEAAQMVAWIFDDTQRPSQSPGRLVHIAQNRNFIYITFGKYDGRYLDYLKEGILNNSFLEMHEFGPWDTNNETEIKDLGPIIVALTIRAHEDQQVERRQGARNREN